MAERTFGDISQAEAAESLRKIDEIEKFISERFPLPGFTWFIAAYGHEDFGVRFATNTQDTDFLASFLRAAADKIEGITEADTTGPTN